MSAALGTLSEERAGAGSSLMRALRQPVGAIGVAVPGTVHGSGYRSRAHAGRLPAAVAEDVHDSVAADVAVAVAQKLHDTTLARTVRVAFVHGTGLTLIVSGALVAAGAILAAFFLPRHTPPSPASRASL